MLKVLHSNRPIKQVQCRCISKLYTFASTSFLLIYLLAFSVLGDLVLHLYYLLFCLLFSFYNK